MNQESVWTFTGVMSLSGKKEMGFRVATEGLILDSNPYSFSTIT